jgi:hypothetical protein
MTTELVTEKPMSTWQRYRTRALIGLGTAGATLIPLASAGSLNDSVSPIIEDMVALFTPLLSLIIAAVPLIIATALKIGKFALPVGASVSS